MWVRNSQRDSYDIGRGTGEMRQWEEKQREAYRMCRETCLVDTEDY
jgi:hypothetical protein